MNRVDRLVATILLLQSKRSITADEIADHFEISVRTVYRDITALGEAGVPVIAEAGVGYSLMQGYHLPPVMFTKSEAQALAMGGVLVESLTDPALREQMKNALLKVSAVLPIEQRLSLSKLSGRTTFYQMREEARDNQEAEIPQLQEALVEQKVVSMNYKDAYGKTSQRCVEPVEMIYYLEKWHLFGWCRLREDYRDFRLDRVEALEVLGERFDLRERDGGSHFIEEWIQKEVKQTVLVRFDRWAVERVEREWMLGSNRITESDDWIEMRLNTGELYYLVNWLLSFGKSAVVMDSLALRELLLERARELMSHHSGK